MAEFLGPRYREIPRWFDEGFAGWSSGGAWPERRARVDVEVCRRTAIEKDIPSLEGEWGDVSMWIAYDFFASFVEFLDGRVTGAISDGELLERVRSVGFAGAFEMTFRERPEEVEGAWRRLLRRRALCIGGKNRKSADRSAEVLR